jgi:hypothetical protein
MNSNYKSEMFYCHVISEKLKQKKTINEGNGIINGIIIIVYYMFGSRFFIFVSFLKRNTYIFFVLRSNGLSFIKVGLVDKLLVIWKNIEMNIEMPNVILNL